jgi:hypothetical protein
MMDQKSEISPPVLKVLDRFIKIVEAADLLGYAHYQSIHHMHKRGLIDFYSLPHNKVKRVLLSDITAILEQSKSEEQNYFEKALSKNKRGRGRPRKFN